MQKKVKKLYNGLKGGITIPADKSISHRAIMFASLAEGKSIIRNFSEGADCISTFEIFQELGADIKYVKENTLEINSSGKLISNRNNIYYCGNSGTTMRLTAGILASQNFNSVLTGDESLSKRPMKRIIEPLTLMGAEIKSSDGKPPLLINGSELHGIEYTSELSSAQVKSCVLLAGLNANGKTTYTEPSKSRNHTERLLKYLGADIYVDGNKVEINPSKLRAKDIEIVGDISSAAFFIVAALIIPNSSITIKNVGINPTRSGIIDIIKRMGGDIQVINPKNLSGEEVADIKVCYSENLKGCTIEGNDIPRLIDELPIIAVLATQCEGQTIVKDAQDLRNKETDRITFLTKELKKIGANIEETPDGFIINGKTQLEGAAELDCYKDHRLAMSFYIAGLICKYDILINGFEWTKISFPTFEELINLIS